MKNCEAPIQLSLLPALEAPHLDWFGGVEFDEPHKPKPGQKFAYITEAHDAAMRQLRLTPSGYCQLNLREEIEYRITP